ncbi:hypothetical protein NA57DRAFT_79626 [Rhizodiscina lignyota]|uniref:Uncharacterized protein n=1 Tax=Rhizodiscina lignyota TaxID=1504668 RepID=A0A9P4M1Z1_9PEZI|nr:hypothetical protein NA57DRAFT_79626 [Rhizodiscina lignyota]
MANLNSAQSQDDARISNRQQNHAISSKTSTGLPSSMELLDWFQELFSSGTTLGSFGAGFTLIIVTQDPSDLKPTTFAPSTVRVFAAISSLLFVLTVLLCQGCKLAFMFQKESIAIALERHSCPITKKVLDIVSLALQVFVLTAFLFFSLVILAFVKSVGIIGVAVTGLLVLAAIVVWALQLSGKFNDTTGQGAIVAVFSGEARPMIRSRRKRRVVEEKAVVPATDRDAARSKQVHFANEHLGNCNGAERTLDARRS